MFASLKKATTTNLSILAMGLLLGVSARAEDTLKVMLIDPLSGPQSATVERATQNLQFSIKRDNDAGGVLGTKVQLITCDDKFNPKDGKNCLDRAIQDDIHYVMQGVGSNVTLTLLDGIEKYNARNPGKEIVFVNWAGQDEEMTNEYCSFWQFRTDAHIGMKMAALVRSVAADPTIKRVYLINMDYSMGQNADAAAKRYLKQMRPDIQIVGSELHPANRVQDFTPYVAKIREAHPDAVITANIGTDLNRLIRAGDDIGLNVRWYTTYASQYGQTTAIGEKGVNHVYQASDSVMSMNEPVIDKIVEDSHAGGYGEFESVRIYRAWLFLSAAIRKAGADQPMKVAKAMENITISAGSYQATMRASDHQAQLPINISILSPEAKFKSDNTPWGYKILKVYSAADVSQPTTCKMKRPLGT
ncbi:amino acid/amide ABC transporter substrate-binding protein, HAAT family [Burkholderia sp. D7]|nr:amino acid/amide ABC transporter substrate-binding protein, HAAT family [Burkholderia sp. D7]